MPRASSASKSRLMRLYGEAVRDGRSISSSIAPEMGAGRMVQRTSALGVVFSSWDATFSSDQEVCGSGGAEDVTVVLCAGDPLAWEFSDGRTPVEVRDGRVCVYRGRGATETMTYRAGARYRFASARIPLERVARTVGRLAPQVDLGVFARRLDLAPVALSSCSRVGVALAGALWSTGEPCLAGLFCEGRAYDLIAACLAAVLDPDLAQAPLATTGLATDDAARLWDARRTIETDPGHAPTVAELAAGAHMSVSKFERDFKALFGMSTHAFVIARRLELARDLIVTTNLSIADIARTVGYGKPGHFSVAFKARYGLSPRQLRQ